MLPGERRVTMGNSTGKGETPSNNHGDKVVVPNGVGGTDSTRSSKRKPVPPPRTSSIRSRTSGANQGSQPAASSESSSSSPESSEGSVVAPTVWNGPPRKPVRGIVKKEEGESMELEPVEKLLTDTPAAAPSSPPPPTFEHLQNIIGSAGAWQLRVFLLAAFSGFCTALHSLIYVFVGTIPNHWCKMPDLNSSNYSEDELKTMLIPKIGKELSHCTTYAYHWNQSVQSLIIDNTTQVKCGTIEFDETENRTTVPMEFNLVCDEAPFASAIQIAYMTGILVGSPIIGGISDRLGRKFAILLATMIFVVVGPLIAFSPNFYVLIALRFVLALGSPGVYATSYVLAIEVTSEKRRGAVGNYFNLPFAFGYMVLPGIAFLVHNWKTLQILLSLPSLILICTWIFLPESPRWLIRKGRLAEAESILRTAARVNGTEQNIPDDFGEMIEKISNTDRIEAAKIAAKSRVAQLVHTYLSIVKSPKMRLRFLVLCFNWTIIGMTYYGLALNSSNLLTSPYIYTFVGGVLEFPAYIMVPPLIKRFGRKQVFIVLVGTCGCSLLFSLFYAKGSNVIIGLSYLGKLMIGAAYSLIYLYSSEMVPTLIRTYGIGLCSMMARLGSTLAPLIVDVVGRDNHMYPSLIFGCLAMFASCLSITLPETKGKPLPETVQDVEKDDSEEEATPAPSPSPCK